jgi:hypothetical protein
MIAAKSADQRILAQENRPLIAAGARHPDR